MSLSIFKRISSVSKRGSQRDFRLLISIVTSVLAKFVAIGSTLITIPITLNYLGTESFGVWMVISGVVGFMAFSDLGIGMGLQNALSKAFGEDDDDSPKYYIANAYLIISVVAIFLSLFVLALFEILPISNLFKVADQALLGIAVSALKYTIIAFFVSMPIILIQRILGGLQKTYIANNVMLVGSVISLISILTSVYFDLGLIGMSVLFVLSPSMALMIYGLYLFYKNKSLRPRISNLSKAHMSPIVSAGAWTVLVQVIYTAKMNIPVMIISSSLGLIAVAEFSIAQKLTGLAAAMVSVALQPLWVVYGEAYHRGDKRWVEKTLKKSLMLVVLLTLPAAVAFQYIGQPLLAMWLGESVVPSKIIIGCFSLWMIASTINICFAMLLNGTGNFKNQAVFSFIFVGLSLVLSFFFVIDVGVAGVVFFTFFVAELARLPFFYAESKRIIGGLSYEVK